MTHEQNPNFKAPELGAPNAAAYYVDHRPGSGAPPFAVKTKEQCAFPDIAEPVYSHPANVAELEARIAALESQVQSYKNTLTYLEAESDRWSQFYPQSSDSRNTFVLFSAKIHNERCKLDGEVK